MVISPTRFVINDLVNESISSFLPEEDFLRFQNSLMNPPDHSQFRYYKNMVHNFYGLENNPTKEKDSKFWKEAYRTRQNLPKFLVGENLTKDLVIDGWIQLHRLPQSDNLLLGNSGFGSPFALLPWRQKDGIVFQRQPGFYFEVIYEKGNVRARRRLDDPVISIGIISKRSPAYRDTRCQVGWSWKTFGWHSDNGLLYLEDAEGEPFFEKINPGNTLGCGVIPQYCTVEFVQLYTLAALLFTISTEFTPISGLQVNSYAPSKVKASTDPIKFEDFVKYSQILFIRNDFPRTGAEVLFKLGEVWKLKPHNVVCEEHSYEAFLVTARERYHELVAQCHKLYLDYPHCFNYFAPHLVISPVRISVFFTLNGELVKDAHGNAVTPTTLNWKDRIFPAVGVESDDELKVRFQLDQTKFDMSSVVPPLSEKEFVDFHLDRLKPLIEPSGIQFVETYEEISEYLRFERLPTCRREFDPVPHYLRRNLSSVNDKFFHIHGIEHNILVMNRFENSPSMPSYVIQEIELTRPETEESEADTYESVL